MVCSFFLQRRAVFLEENTCQFHHHIGKQSLCVGIKTLLPLTRNPTKKDGTKNVSNWIKMSTFLKIVSIYPYFKAFFFYSCRSLVLNKCTFLILELFCPSQRKPLGLKSTPTQSPMTALLPSPRRLHHLCMDEMGHCIIAEKASANWQMTAFAGLLSGLILTMTTPRNYFRSRGSQRQGGVPKDGGWGVGGGGPGVKASDNHPPTHTDRQSQAYEYGCPLYKCNINRVRENCGNTPRSQIIMFKS